MISMTAAFRNQCRRWLYITYTGICCCCRSAAFPLSMSIRRPLVPYLTCVWHQLSLLPVQVVRVCHSCMPRTRSNAHITPEILLKLWIWEYQVSRDCIPMIVHNIFYSVGACLLRFLHINALTNLVVTMSPYRRSSTATLWVCITLESRWYLYYSSHWID